MNETKMRQLIRRVYVECCRQLLKAPMRRHDFEQAMLRETAPYTDAEGTIDGGDLRTALERVIRSTI